MIRPLIASILVLAIGASPTAGRPVAIAFDFLDDDLTNLASTLSCCAGSTVTATEGRVPGWRWDSENDTWRIDPYRGFAKGAAEEPPTGEIVLWPEVHDYDPNAPLSEQPEFLAESLRTLAHECLHSKCPPHAGPPPGTTVPDPPANPDNPPSGDGRDPDCNDINYAIHTAKALCGQMTDIATNGGPVTGSDGTPVPGTETPEGLCAYCEALKKAYGEMQERWNTEDNAETAEACASSGWEPENEEEEGAGDDFSNCPDFPPPPGPPGDPYPGNKVIPDCNAQCPCEN